MPTTEPAPDVLADDDDELDGTGVDYTADPISDEELDLVVLSPDGDPEKVKQYAEMFGGANG